MLVSRIAIRYRSFTRLVRDEETLGFFDYEVSTQGRPYRLPKDPAEDLFATRTWLQTSGFRLTDTERNGGRSNIESATYIERWHLWPQPSWAHRIAAPVQTKEAPAAATVEASVPDTSARNPDNHQDTTTCTIPQAVIVWSGGAS
jgi:hypothetical protein